MMFDCSMLARARLRGVGVCGVMRMCCPFVCGVLGPDMQAVLLVHDRIHNAQNAITHTARYTNTCQIFNLQTKNEVTHTYVQMLPEYSL
jgi:hypothetical protein